MQHVSDQRREQVRIERSLPITPIFVLIAGFVTLSTLHGVLYAATKTITFQTRRDVGTPVMDAEMLQASTVYGYSVLKTADGFVLAHAQKGENGQQSGTTETLAHFGQGFGLDEADSVLSLQLSPDGQYLAIDGTREQGEQVWVYNIQQMTLNLVPSYAIGNFLHWLPGGHTFLYRPMFPSGPAATEDGKGWNPGLWIVDAATGVHQNIAISVPSAFLVDAAPSPDGSHIIYSTTTGLGMGSDTWIMNSDGRSSKHLFSTPGGPQSIAGLFTWSPDGTKIAYELLSDAPVPFRPAGLWLMDSLGQHQHWLADVDGGHGYTPTWSPDSHKLAFVVRTNEHDRRADTDMQSLQSAIAVVDITSGRSWLVASRAQTGMQININPTWVADSSSITFTAFSPQNNAPRYLSAQVAHSQEQSWAGFSTSNKVEVNQEQASTNENIAQSSFMTHYQPVKTAPVPFMHRPYYGNRTIEQRAISFVDHDKPWYVQDGLFVRYDGAKWKNVPIGSCTPRVNCYDGHNGYDLDMWYEPVLSVAAGTVIRAGWNDPLNHAAALGLWAAVDHGNNYITAYGHLSALSVSVGDEIGVQWLIGTTGSSGSSTGPHLHLSTFVLPNWDATDPSGWTGNYPDPNTVPDNYLWVKNPVTSYTIPILSGNALYPGAILVDDGGPGWSTTGTRTSASASSDINGGLHWTATSNGDPTATATWQRKLSGNGYYEVGVFVDDNHATSSWVPYTIYSVDPSHPNRTIQHTVYVDETHIGSFQGPYGRENLGPQWISLGTFFFKTSLPARVVLNNATGEKGAQLAADGVEFVPLY